MTRHRSLRMLYRSAELERKTGLVPYFHIWSELLHGYPIECVRIKARRFAKCIGPVRRKYSALKGLYVGM